MLTLQQSNGFFFKNFNFPLAQRKFQCRWIFIFALTHLAALTQWRANRHTDTQAHTTHNRKRYVEVRKGQRVNRFGSFFISLFSIFIWPQCWWRSNDESRWPEWNEIKPQPSGGVSSSKSSAYSLALMTYDEFSNNKHNCSASEARIRSAGRCTMII